LINFGCLEGCVSARSGYGRAEMKSFSVLLVAVSLFAVSCERHEFEGPDGTKQLHQHHGKSSGHGEDKAHATKHADHAEKKAAH
jgi:hypothetical protein